MLNSVSHLAGSTVTATDGAIGSAETVFFDDQTWTIRYLVVNAGSWMTGREVLISPYSVKQPLGSGDNIDVWLTRQQVMDSPDIDTHQPVSRQHEREVLGHYGYPEYWDGGGLWALDAIPFLPPALPTPAELAERSAARARDVRSGDVHLRSSEKVSGYDIQASDESIGHVVDFIFDDESWTIRYLVIDTRNWWPGGRKVLIATHWVDGIDWATRTVRVALTRAQVKLSPPYEDVAAIGRDYEKQLHDAFDRQGYWD